MFADLEKDCISVTVSENGASFAMLVDAMYAPDRKGPLTEDCIDELSGKESRLRCMVHDMSDSSKDIKHNEPASCADSVWYGF